MKIGLVFPHQLFEQNPLFQYVDTCYIIEEFLFFQQYQFHQQKIAFHRASMKFYEQYLLSQNKQVVYVSATEPISDIRQLIPYLKTKAVDHIFYINPTDNWLEKRLKKALKQSEVESTEMESPMFMNSVHSLQEYFAPRKRFFQTDFYKHQRIINNILINKQQQPLGGKWSFDDENRLKYPKGKLPPKCDFLAQNSFYKEARMYTQLNFAHHYGNSNPEINYPSTFDESKAWLKEFLKHRFFEFGAYEDAIVARHTVLHHSVLTPMMNVGLLTPKYVLDEVIRFADENDVPLNSLEGFVRQVLGWREFIRAVYELKGTAERTKNFWGFKRKIPESFWTGTTGILPVDQTIKKVLETGYCHHIERLMILGNFMLLCEFDPNEVYRWFMELFIDAYDWVMVPNVYGMSQFADGGIMSTKPYISGSNYLMKMSDYPKGDWQKIWDGLFWRFMHEHSDFFGQNPRLGMLLNSLNKMEESKRLAHFEHANKFLEKL